MPVKNFLAGTLTTRRHAFSWVSIWFALLITSWFCRPLLPYQEVGIASISWEMWVSGNYWFPVLNGAWVEEFFPLIHWLELLMWRIFGVSELSIRLLAGLFSIGTLFLTALAAYQLWPDNRSVRANAPLILIGSLMWSIFATAHIAQIYITFFSLLAINFLIRAWRFHSIWWIGFSLSLLLGLFTSGIAFLIYTLPVALMAPAWKKNYYRWYFYTFLSVICALSIYGLWGFWNVYHHPNLNLTALLGINTLISQFNDPLPLGTSILYLIIILFPWVLWLPLYRFFLHTEKDEQLRFCITWFVSILFLVMLTSNTPLTPFIPIYPAFCLIIARACKNAGSRPKDIALICLVMLIIGLILVGIPYLVTIFNLPSWVDNISPFWGIGLILFSITLWLQARETRLTTLALMSVALTLAVNFGVVRVAMNFYDLMPIGERIGWYQAKNIPIAHQGRYQGQYHFVGRLEKPLIIIRNNQDFLIFKKENPSGRVILYVDTMTPELRKKSEYWQPFRSRYLMIVSALEVEEV